MVSFTKVPSEKVTFTVLSKEEREEEEKEEEEEEEIAEECTTVENQPNRLGDVLPQGRHLSLLIRRGDGWVGVCVDNHSGVNLGMI